MKEHIAVAEAKRLGIPVFAMVDTNSDPRKIDFAIPANDDATKSISKILDVAIEAIAEGLADRKVDKDKGEEVPATAEKKEDRKPATRKRTPKA
jgi:small subunit ribosomal protein S2